MKTPPPEVFCYTGPMDHPDARNDISVKDYIASIDDEQMVKDAETLVGMMGRISGEKPKLYGIGTIGFGMYHYKYASGREGDAHTLGFYPRKGKITIYFMDGTAPAAELLTKLGKHTTTGYCLYIKRLSDIDLSVLEQIVRQSYDHITSKYQAGPIDHILWQPEK
jgi:hypothetical protein